ncbi:MAG: zinc permease [Candidatus Nephrothrix sp. EaCA]|nr:MAG: zinc permease [Candidatus Nephrothrix sp. EaCA]
MLVGVNSILLFCAAFFTGIAALFVPKVTQRYRLMLVFAGAYLFSVTLIHLLPDIFSHAEKAEVLGIYVLLGFFLQQGLEFFSHGVEHGHVHVHDKQHAAAGGTVFLALSAHSVIEGCMLAYPVAAHEQRPSLLLGILLHKAPEAFALMSVLLCEAKKARALILLGLFSSATPAGFLLTRYLAIHEIFSPHIFTIMVAVACGGFLHISTTIVFESSVEHRFNAKKTGVAVAGALTAIAVELFL